MIAPPPRGPVVRVAYLGTPELAVPPLRALVAAGVEVALVVSQPDRRRGRGSDVVPSPVKAAALELGLPVSDQVEDVLTADVQLGVVVAFGRLIKPPVLDAVPMVNLHFSLLPRWRGAAPVERAILAGDDRTGVDLMVVEEGLDTGGIYARAEVPIGPDDSLEELRGALVRAGTSLLVDAMVNGLGPARPQDGEPTYAKKLDPEDRHLDWTAPTFDVHRRVRLGDAWTTHDGRRLKVWRTNLPPTDGGVVVPAGDGPIELVEVQPEGKGRMGARDWLNGVRWTAGDRLGLVTDARVLALDALDRIERDGAYANLVLSPMLDRSSLEARDRGFVTELVYGTTRMRRACDFLVDRFLTRDLDVRVRNALRLGAYQLHFMGMPPHAAVGETVSAAPKPARGLVNAVLRRVADNEVVWPDDATRLSYPDWVVERLTEDLGADVATVALEVMNRAPEVTERADGYIQDLGSQWVAEAVGALAGERVADLCAAPGGKAMLLAAAGAHVVAADIRKSRVGLIRQNERAEHPMALLAADAARPPIAPGSLDRVLIDAPCSGLGTLRRRADARWRLDAAAPERLGLVQRELVDAAIDLLRPGGTLIYSVCTITAAETLAIDSHLAAARPELVAVPPPASPWQPHGRGALLLPQSADTDGMYLLRLRRP